ncbi:hypothetical protein ABEB36_006418 [Hypothenemus hampei]|uniref:Protein Asterix n=1 Tax=Hypothenemus hampei TaxID=57062 RepID=A0ABD1ESQ0_HYPHA
MNADPRRPDKVQRYVPNKNATNGEDLTSDYMNIMGQPPTTANAAGASMMEKHHQDTNVEPHHHLANSCPDEIQTNDELTVTTNAANVIPTSPQYGVAIIPNNLTATNADLTHSDTITVPSDGLSETAAGKTLNEDPKDIHATPSRNERFKVVKIASLEPFKRGRWKCMDYVDEAPPPNVNNPNSNMIGGNKTSQSVGNASITPGVYLQTQSLPQQQIQQMLLQGGFTNGTQFFPNVPAQLIPQGQYFYPQVQQGQTVPQPVPSTMPTQFLNNQPYFTAGVVTNPGFTLPQSYPNIQYVPIPAQGSAFVPTSQTTVHLPANFQQSQSYSGQPTVSQANLTQSNSLVNGHAFLQEQNNSQSGKNVIVVNSQPQLVQNPPLVVQTQQQPFQQQNSTSNAASNFQPQNSSGVVVQQAPQQQQQQLTQQQHQQGFDASSVYTNPQFTMSVNSLTVLDATNEPANQEVLKETNSVVEAVASDNANEDPNKNPVVNAIDNKIEQAMDLVKSHLMYTVREEVEVLKEKIAELMEKIQQLETENNYLRAQIPKNQTLAPPPTTTNTVLPQNIAVVNPTPSVIQAQITPNVTNAPVPVTSNPPSQQAIPNSNNSNTVTTAAQSTPKDPAQQQQ